MKKRYLMIAFVVLLFGLGMNKFAQGIPKVKTNANRCEQFKIQVITPVDETKYKLIVAEPAKEVEDKGMVTNPCETT
ncbi:MAG: hypothetical protein M3X11_06800 [Acidobacteriota bacterium]|nr:hypothetical protein [Acidobacteriota bacterium]